MRAGEIVVEAAARPPLAERRLEICEHKGVGHPDTLTDGACEAAAVALAGAYRQAFGAPMHFNVDKGLLAAGSGVVLPLIAFLATLEIQTRPGAALGALTAAGGLGQALGSLSGGALYGYAGMGMFTATAFAVALGAWLASPSCAPRWLGGENACTRI